jgi:hypothetical protein
MTPVQPHLIRNVTIWAISVVALFIAALIAEGAGFAAAVTFAVVTTAAIAVPFIVISREERELPLYARARTLTRGRARPHH